MGTPAPVLGTQLHLGGPQPQFWGIQAPVWGGTHLDLGGLPSPGFEGLQPQFGGSWSDLGESQPQFWGSQPWFWGTQLDLGDPQPRFVVLPVHFSLAGS